MSGAGAWEVIEHRGGAGTLHALDPGEVHHRQVWRMTIDRPALVLGSTQSDAVVRRDLLEERGIDLVRRRSGGGAVLLLPGEVAWVDLVLPRDDRLVAADVGASFGWLGAAWVAALAEASLVGTVHEGPVVRTARSSLVCFAGLGRGEVTVGGRKVVGLSQRRTSGWVRFQCLAYRAPHLAELADLLLGEDGADLSVEDVAADGIGPVIDRVLDHLLVHLPD